MDNIPLAWKWFVIIGIMALLQALLGDKSPTLSGIIGCVGIILVFGVFFIPNLQEAKVLFSQFAPDDEGDENSLWQKMKDYVPGVRFALVVMFITFFIPFPPLTGLLCLYVIIKAEDCLPKLMVFGGIIPICYWTIAYISTIQKALEATHGT